MSASPKLYIQVAVKYGSACSHVSIRQLLQRLVFEEHSLAQMELAGLTLQMRDFSVDIVKSSCLVMSEEDMQPI